MSGGITVGNEKARKTLRYAPWQVWAAWGRLWAFLVLLGFAFWFAQHWLLVSLLLALPAALYLYATALGPLLRSSLRVVLEPEGIRVGEKLYLRERFAGVEGPMGRWTWMEERLGGLLSYRYRLRLAWRFSNKPLFYLVFGEERVPLWLDLPGWDQVLAHLGLDWREHPGLRRYLYTARGLAWLNGLIYPPAEAEGPWREARRRYRQVCGWMWAGVGLCLLGVLVSGWIPEEGVGFGLWLVVSFAGLYLWTYFFLTTFNVGRGRPGWAVAYTPLRPPEGVEGGI